MYSLVSNTFVFQSTGCVDATSQTCLFYRPFDRPFAPLIVLLIAPLPSDRQSKSFFPYHNLNQRLFYTLIIMLEPNGFSGVNFRWDFFHNPTID